MKIYGNISMAIYMIYAVGHSVGRAMGRARGKGKAVKLPLPSNAINFPICLPAFFFEEILFGNS